MHLICIIIAILPGFINGEIRISLNSGQFSGQWTVRNDSSDLSVNANVPGGIYSDLNVAHDLFNAQNMEYKDNYRWIGYENWTYETTFELSREILDKVSVNLVFHGIDTIGDVYVNGKLMQSVNNMFVRYVIPIKNVAKEGSNTLQVKLKSPILAAKELADAYGYEVPPNCTSPVQHGECHINFLRKMQASFSSELGPAVPSVGIWKSVEIEGFNTAIVRSVAATVQKANNTFLVDVVCHFEGAMNHHAYLFAIKLNYSDYSFYSKYNSNATSIPNEATTTGYNHFMLNTTLKIEEDPRYVWWPNGYGHQPLWDLSCEVIPPHAETNSESSIMKIKTGLRTVNVIQGDMSNGSSLSLTVNDVPIFARGAIWIPSHILPDLASDERTIRRLMQSVKDVNMNMLRVWGGGIYESDLFYEIADQLGILIWQDMMFASALYPANEEFLQSVALEVDQQMKRLVAHPSIVIWAGNNDIDEILATNRFHIQDNTRYFQDYFTVFENTIKPIVKRHDHSLWYTISILSKDYKAGDPAVDGGGHFLTADRNPWYSSSYKSLESTSKYNLQSIPSFKTMSEVSKPEDLKLSSEFSKFRQHNPGGYEEMIKLINYNLPLPVDDGSKDFYETFIYYSQITQAMAKKIEIEKYRIYRSRASNTTSKNAANSMAALIWHLNDVWQGPTCSSIEFGGRWKMLHYYAAKFFAPIILAPEFQPNGDLIIFGVSDLLHNINGRLYIYLFSWDTMDYLDKTEKRVSLQPSSSTLLTTITLPTLWKNWKDFNDSDAESCFLYFRFEGDNNTFAENFYYPSSFSEISNFRQAKLTVKVKENDSTTYDKVQENSVNNEVLIYLDTTQIAPFVWLETDAEGIFSDNGFTLIEGTKSVKFTNGNEKVDVTKLKETLKVRSLRLSSTISSSIRLVSCLTLHSFLFVILKALI